MCLLVWRFVDKSMLMRAILFAASGLYTLALAWVLRTIHRPIGFVLTLGLLMLAVAAIDVSLIRYDWKHREQGGKNEVGDNERL